MVTKKKKKVTKKATKKAKPVNTPEKYVFGRPTKYDRSYPQKVFEACKEGKCLTIASLCCLLDIDRDTYYEWCKKFPDFSNAIKKGCEYRKMHMEERGLKGMHQGKQFNGVPWLFLLKNMFPDEYSDRKEIELSGDSDKPIKTLSFNFKEDPDDLDKRGGEPVE